MLSPIVQGFPSNWSACWTSLRDFDCDTGKVRIRFVQESSMREKKGCTGSSIDESRQNCQGEGGNETEWLIVIWEGGTTLLEVYDGG
jgi:hypothetical protein